MTSTALPVGPMAVTPSPAVGGGSSDAAASSAQGGEDFLALVQQLLEGAEIQPTVPSAAPSVETGAETEGEAGAPEQTGALWAPVPPGLALAVPAAAPALGTPAGGTPVDASATAGPAGLSQEGAAPTTGAAGGGSAQPDTDGQATSSGAGTLVPDAAQVTDTTQLPDAAAAEVPVVTTGPAAVVESAAPTTPAGSPAAVTAPATVSGTGTVEAPVAPAAARVTEQVFPEVIRIAGNGHGMQRLTLRLQPENLGEVRVVLISRPGEQLVVSLAAGVEAQESLLNGSSELRRLLETIGNGDARIVVRDLTSTGASQSASGQQFGQQLGQQAGQQAGADVMAGDLGADGSTANNGDPDGEPNSNQHAGTRGSNSATDGTDGAALSPHRVDPVTGARVAGIDVTV